VNLASAPAAPAATMAGMPRLPPRSALVAAVVIMIAKMTGSLPRLEQETAALVVITWATVAAFLVVGLLLFGTGVPRANAWACLAVAASTVPGDLAEEYYAKWWLTPVGYTLEQLYLPAAVALVIRYPRARLQRTDRALVAFLVLSAVVLRLPQIFTAGQDTGGFVAPAGWPVLVRSDVLHDWVLLRGSLVLTTVGLAVAAVRLLRRAVTARGLERQSILGICAVGTLTALFAALAQLSWLSPETSTWSWIPAMVRDLSAVALPAALLGDLLRRRAAGSAVAVRVIGAAQSGVPGRLRAALAESLVDPSVQVWLPSATPGWVRWDGERVAVLPVHPHRRLEVVRDASGDELCAVSVDRRAVQDEEVFHSALRAVRLGLENDRLRAEILARMAELERSRERIVEAAAAERRQVERDLHDGAQQQLLAVAASLARVGLIEDPERMREAVGGARTQLALALAELRRLARGIHPAVLSQGGLAAALPGLGETATVPTQVLLGESVVGRRLRSSVELTAYFVVAEALTNVARYAHAGAVEVRVDLVGAPDPALAGVNGAAAAKLTVTVTDDGVGGARLRPGGGLTGLSDRVQALGGTLTVGEGGGGRGTTVRAELPLERVGAL
jgi:signal transduction histidine kinase